ncbi:MAG: hypothetical protein RL141_585, partial [Candidatus Parcubacteria bacterium]
FSVRDAARLLYYGSFGYDVLGIEDRVPEPNRPLNRGIAIARHTGEDQDRALDLVEMFEREYPGRARRFQYIPPNIINTLNKR